MTYQSIQNVELTRIINKIDIHSKSVKFNVKSISSNIEYDDNYVFKSQTDVVSLNGGIKGKYFVELTYTLKYNFGISNDYENIIDGKYMTKEDGKYKITDFPKELDNENDLIQYLNTQFK
jgi:hypothetical protein